MPRDPRLLSCSPTLAETMLAVDGLRARQIPVQGYGPAQRVLAGIVAVALAIGAALPVRATVAPDAGVSVCRIDIGSGTGAPAFGRACRAAGR